MNARAKPSASDDTRHPPRELFSRRRAPSFALQDVTRSPGGVCFMHIVVRVAGKGHHQLFSGRTVDRIHLRANGVEQHRAA